MIVSRKAWKMDFELYDNYVFDLYGTLIDIHTDEHALSTWKKWSKWLDYRGLRHAGIFPMRETFFKMDANYRKEAQAHWCFDYPEIDVLPIYKEMFLSYGNDEKILTKELLSEAGNVFREASRSYMYLFPYVLSFFDLLHEKGKKVYILSNAQRSFTWPEICYFELDKVVDDILISSDERAMKPDKAFFEALSQKHQFDKSRTIMFGDSYENDYKGALNAGWNALLLSGENAPTKFYAKETGNV